MYRSLLFDVSNAIESEIAKSYQNWLATREFESLIHVAILQRSLLINFNSDFIDQFGNSKELEFKIPREWKTIDVGSKKIKTKSVFYLVKQILKTIYCFIYSLTKIPRIRIDHNKRNIFFMDVYDQNFCTFKKEDIKQTWPINFPDSGALHIGRRGKAGFSSELELVLLHNETSAFKLISSFLKTIYVASSYAKKYGFEASFGIAPELYKFYIFDPSKFNVETELLYSASAKIYRPLWTYKLDDIGAKTSCYFYSTNHVLLNRSKWVQKTPLGFCSMTWKKYYLWDEFQVLFFKKTLAAEPEFEQCGTISIPNHNLKPEQLVLKCKPYIAVFDVTPFEDRHVKNLFAVHPELHSQETMSQFLDDIIQLGDELGFDVVIKTKRSVGSKFNKKYINKLEALSNFDKIHVYYDDVDPVDIISAANIVISYPFTSTNIIAKSKGIPSLFYDPTASILPCLNVDRGIPLILGIEELRKKMHKLNDKI